MPTIEDAKWYIINTYSGFEAKVKQSLENSIEMNNLQDYIYDIQIPMEKTIEEKNGKKKEVERKVMPGYVFLKMIYTNELGYLITRETRGVISFVGPRGMAKELSETEIKRMGLEKGTTVASDFNVGDNVKVMSGALEGFSGIITEVNSTAGRAKVKVEMFGRETNVELDLGQIEIIERI